MKPAEKAIRSYQKSAAKQGSEDQGQIHGLLKGRESGARKAAKFLLLLSKDDASEILKKLSADEVERIAVEVSRIRKIDLSEARSILDEFGHLERRGGAKRGGPDVAKEMLALAFGDERGNSLFYRTVPTGRLNPFDFLDELEFQQILMVLKNEPGPVLSVILPYMQPDKAARIVEALHPDLQREVTRRVSRLRNVDPETLSKVAESLRDRIRRQGKIVTEEVDGRAALADILRYISPDSESDILSDLKEYDPELSKDIEERMLTIGVVFQLRDADLQAVLRDFSETEIATVLKGKSEDIRTQIFGGVSERRGMLIREEMDRIGPMKRSEVATATKEFLLYIRDLEDEGRVVIIQEDEYLVD